MCSDAEVKDRLFKQLQGYKNLLADIYEADGILFLSWSDQSSFAA